MTQEEKANAYDKAIEKIKYVMEHGVSPVLNKEDLQDIFPELRDSKDERIKKEILELVSISGNGNQFEEIKDWLEKQGKLKWTEEDEDNLNMAIYFMRSENTPYSPTDVEPVVKWLCGLKLRMEE